MDEDLRSEREKDVKGIGDGRGGAGGEGGTTKPLCLCHLGFDDESGQIGGLRSLVFVQYLSVGTKSGGREISSPREKWQMMR